MVENQSHSKDNNGIDNSSLKRVGNFIKEARLAREQSISELASILKIGEHQLKAIEEGDEKNLPEEVFIKAMVRRISDKLKLDTEFIMREFHNIREEVKIEKVSEEDTSNSKKNKTINPKNILSFIIFIILSGLFGLIASSFFLNFMSDSFQNQSQQIELLEKD